MHSDALNVGFVRMMTKILVGIAIVSCAREPQATTTPVEEARSVERAEPAALPEPVQPVEKVQAETASGTIHNSTQIQNNLGLNCVGSTCIQNNQQPAPAEDARCAVLPALLAQSGPLKDELVQSNASLEARQAVHRWFDEVKFALRSEAQRAAWDQVPVPAVSPRSATYPQDDGSYFSNLIARRRYLGEFIARVCD